MLTPKHCFLLLQYLIDINSDHEALLMEVLTRLPIELRLVLLKYLRSEHKAGTVESLFKASANSPECLRSYGFTEWQFEYAGGTYVHYMSPEARSLKRLFETVIPAQIKFNEKTLKELNSIAVPDALEYDDIIDHKTAAALLRISEKTLYNLVWRGIVPKVERLNPDGTVSKFNYYSRKQLLSMFRHKIYPNEQLRRITGSN